MLIIIKIEKHLSMNNVQVDDDDNDDWDDYN